MGDAKKARGDDECSILLVDDDAGVLTVLQRALSGPGVRISVASTGVQALERLAEGAFDVVVSDVQMPEMNGLKLLRTVREYDLDLPILLMTGQPDVRGAAAAVEYGAFQYLIKPVSVERLRAVVDKAINAGRIARLKRHCAEEFGSGSFYVGDRAGIETKLDKALSSLSIAYQPIVRSSDGGLFGHEALLRSEEPTLPHPGAVLKAAARVRRIHDVGRAVRDLVATQAHAATLRGRFFFVNVHTEDLMDPALYLPASPLSRIARNVVLELTDRASLEHVTDASERIERLRALGYRIALDDLGAGLAGLTTFTQLEPEFVKIDTSVIRGMNKDANKADTVRSIVRVCHNLGKAVIAEGVETKEERDALLEVECDFMQGYFFGRPGPLIDGDDVAIEQRGVA
jgi:EAL domain-containing protein (putative c-di-GMP-specific phosphodiesterase class I)